jgi:hypothetical protein
MSFRIVPVNIVREQPEQPVEPLALAAHVRAQVIEQVATARALAAEILEICGRYGGGENDFRGLDHPARVAKLTIDRCEDHALHSAPMQYLRPDLNEMLALVEKLNGIAVQCHTYDKRHQERKEAYAARCKALATEIAARVPVELRTQAEGGAGGCPAGQG